MPLNEQIRHRSTRWRSTPVSKSIGKPELNAAERLAAVTEIYEYLRDFYQSEVISYSRRFGLLQSTAIAGGAVTPVLLLFDFGKLWWRGIAAIPSAIGAIAAGISGAFRYRQEWASSYYTLSKIADEYDRFRSRTAPLYGSDLSIDQIIDNFQDRLTAMTMEELERGFESTKREDNRSNPHT